MHSGVASEYSGEDNGHRSQLILGLVFEDSVRPAGVTSSVPSPDIWATVGGYFLAVVWYVLR